MQLIDNNTSLTLSNQQFLSAIFGELLWPGVHVTGFACRPENTGVVEWAGQYAYLASEQAMLERFDLNQYFTVSTFRPDGSGRSRRRKADFMAQFCLVLDDLGTGVGAKVPWDLAIDKPVFSWVLETSPDNYQAGYIFRVPVSDADLLVRLVDAMIAQGLMSDRDPGMRGVTRYVRMPLGFNNKEKYEVIGADGVAAPPFQCRMVTWNPGLKYSVEEIVAGWGLQLAAPGTSGVGVGGVGGRVAGVGGRVAGVGRGAGQAGAGMLNSGEEGDYFDLIEVVLDEIGLRGRAQGNGFFGCPCPNEAEHTIKDGRTGYDPVQGFKCFHGSCESLHRGDLKSWLKSEYGEAYDRVVENRITDPSYVESMFGPPTPMPTMVNAETGMVEVMPPRVVENTFPWFVNRAQALSPDAPDAQAIESLIADGVVYLGNIEMDRLLGVINEYTGVTKQRLRTSESNAKKVLMQSGRMPGGGVPVGETLSQVELDNQGQAGVVSEQGVPVAGELPRLAVGDYMHVYPDTLPLADRIQVKPTTDNLIGLLEYTRIGVFFNKMTKRVVIDDHGMYGFGVKDADGIKTRLTDLMIRCGMSDARSKEMIRETAMMNQYHPVVGYLSGAVWDGVDRFEEVMRCLTTDDPIHFEKVFRRWLVSIVAAVFGYGKIPPRGVLTFVGNQYIGKTSFLKKLSPQVPGSFKEGIHLSLSGFGETDSVRKSTTALLVELGELDATFRKSDIAALKAFIGRDTDEYRLPYGTDFVEWPRQTVFAASVNHSEFLQDTTGNTRFWTVGVSSINLDAMSKIDNRQLWLQIKGWYDQGEAWTMTRQEMQQVEDKNAEHREVGVLEEELLTYFDWDDPVYVAGKPWSSATGRGENAVIRMTAREIARKIGMENLFGSANKFNRDLSTALKVLTGMQTPYKTKINRKIVRVWFLPRMLDVSGNVQPHGRIH